MHRLFFEVFEHIPRQGPGHRASTERAFRLCKELPSAPRILDLPEEAWWDDFYTPMERRIAELRGTYTVDKEALAALDDGHPYGYAFFVARRPCGVVADSGL